MRAAATGLMVCMCVVAVGQQMARPKKVLTPEQVAHQEKSKAYYAELQRLRASAKAAYQAEVDREKAGDCPKAMTTVDINHCLSHEIEVTEANYKVYTSGLRALLALSAPDATTLEGNGPTGHFATSAENSAAFDAAEATWQSYAKAECDAIDKYWRGGTIVGAMYGECRLRTIRARFHELDDAYDMLLRG